MNQLHPPHPNQHTKSRQLNKNILSQIAFVSKILFPNFPSHFFPIFAFLELLKRNKIKLNMKRFELKFYLKPIPNKLYDLLIEDETIKSEHIAFVSDYIFETFILDPKFNWMNLILLNSSNRSSEAQLIKILKRSHCELNTIFIKENFYENFLKNNEILDGQNNEINVSLNEIPNSYNFPKIATKATISMVNLPYDMNTEILDLVITKFFENPRLLHRNYFYEISIDESLIGSYNYAKYFTIFSKVKKIFFKLINLESKENDFELCSIVAKNFTNLNISSSFVMNFNGRQKLDDLSFITKIPNGLLLYYNKLKTCINPFVDIKMKQRNNSSNDFLTNIHPIFLLHGDRGVGKLTILESLAFELGIQMYCADCMDIVSNVHAQTEAKLKNVFSRLKLCQPLIITLQNFELFGVDEEGNEDLRLISTLQAELFELFTQEHKLPIIIVAVFNDKQIHPMIQRLFLETIHIKSPNQDERFEILKWLKIKESFNEKIFNSDIKDVPLVSVNNSNKINGLIIENDKILEEIANLTQGFLYGDLKLLIDSSIKSMKSQSQLELKREFIEKILGNLQLNFADSLGAPKVPKVLWSDIGGLSKIKEEIQSSIGLPLKHMHLLGKNMKRSGILLYGPPGTGKTLVAKAVATECNLSFLSVQGPELLNMYVGQSERNVREVFERARSAAPCVIFLDELDSLAPNRGVAGDSGGVMDRVVSQLLAEMDGMAHDSDPTKQIFILAATNRPDLIDPALLRPGRFDKLFYVGPCTTTDDKLLVLKAITNKFNFDEKLKLENVAEMLRLDMTGADLFSICSNAWLCAVRRTILHDKNKKNSTKVIVNLDDFKSSTEKFIPSISKKDLDYFNQLKTTYS